MRTWSTFKGTRYILLLSDSENSDNEVLVDHPYSVPDDWSENDDKYEELNFTEFSQGSVIPTYAELHHHVKDVLTWCECKNCTQPQFYIEAVCCQDRTEIMTKLPGSSMCVAE